MAAKWNVYVLVLTFNILLNFIFYINIRQSSWTFLFPKYISALKFYIVHNVFLLNVFVSKIYFIINNLDGSQCVCLYPACQPLECSHLVKHPDLLFFCLPFRQEYEGYWLTALLDNQCLSSLIIHALKIHPDLHIIRTTL